ncbi:TonB-dependent siderophore receptor [Martelella mediterranea]|uniref:Iron complex outermembrane receptor protein n=1 Tax=Martelella mediterranea TaxID=293089 RepID=A0A4R3NG73_9HYPH|nr:TonB-dependent siderophore receptor [Martelella mediterranea]TCT32662.1 iron complex outermembrane receptor protein [Martelella mediterranea]
MDHPKNKKHDERSTLGYRAAVLLGCTALAATPTTLLAQDQITASAPVSSDADTTVLEPVYIDLNAYGDNDANSIVALGSSGGGRLSQNILDIPASVSVITAKEIQQRDAQTVEQVLDYTAGVTTDFYGSDDRFDFFKIRGFDAYTYRDGLPLGSAFGGVREEPYAFERVEVLKGADSTIYGVSDPGGTVNYVSKQPKRERFGEAYVTGGSFSHAEAGFDFGDNLTEDDTLSYRLTGKFRNADAEYDYSRDDETFVMGGFTWRPSDATRMTLIYDYLDTKGTPGGGGHPIGSDFDRSFFLGEPDYNYNDVNRNTVTWMFDHDFGSGLSFSSKARYTNADTGFGYAYVYEMVNDGDTIADRYYYGNDSSYDDFVIDAHFQYDTSFENVDSRTLAGLQYDTYSGSSDTYYAPAPGIDWTNPVYSGGPNYSGPYQSRKNEQKTTSLYLQQELTFADKVIASVGLRNDWLDLKQRNKLTGISESGDFSEFTARAGLTYRVTDEVSTYASYAQSVAPPSLGVDPERGEQYEVGVKYAPLAFPALLSASVYDLTKDNITVTNPATNMQETIGKSRVRGVDLEAKAELMNNISFTAAYSYMMSDIVEDGTSGNVGNQLSFVPNNVASLWVDYKLEGEGRRGDMTFGLGARYQSSYYFAEDNAISSDPNITFDAAFTYQVAENTTFQVNATNLFNEKYIAYGGYGADWYNQGRAVYATLRQTW